MLYQYLFNIGTKKVKNNFLLILCQKFVIVGTKKIAYAVHFVIEILFENLFNLW